MSRSSSIGLAGLAFVLLAALAALPARAQPLRPHVLFVLDTSTSMLDPPDALTGKDGSPLCGGEGQGSRLYRLKQALRTTLAEVGTDEANFGLARFPQLTTPETTRGCYRGHTVASVSAGPGAGCKTSAASELPDGAFFTTAVAQEVVAVPVTGALPAGPGDFDPRGANIAAVLRWVNNVEASNGTAMTDPELRATAAKAPLAGALWYARLYFERYVSPQDPKAGCRKNIVVLMTDGDDSCGGDVLSRAGELFAAGVELHVVVQANEHLPLHDQLADRGSGGRRKQAIKVDFTNPAATKAVLLAIVAEAVPPSETCNGLDDNCNGQVDEPPLPLVGTACLCPGLTEAQVGRGVCKQGALACKGGGGVVCEGCVLPGLELCNGLDDDCDGEIDERFPLGKACDNGARGACQRRGIYVCSPDGQNVVCDAPVGTPTVEICNGVDDDCNGILDDGRLEGEGLDCGATLGVCMAGKTRCVGGKFVCQGQMSGGEELCNGRDDDCNGLIDEDVLGAGQACVCGDHDAKTLTTGECRMGSLSCQGRGVLECVGCVPPRAETCDCKDNDCDGAIDEGDPCGKGFACVGCKCEIACDPGGRRCPPGFACDDRTAPPICRGQRCKDVVCDRPGWRCDEATGKCVDPCKDVTCPAPQRCEAGQCVDCYRTGCPEGQLCLQGQCRGNPCDGRLCGDGQYCDRGECLPLCVPGCPSDQTCVRGQCKADPCARISCEAGKVCDPVTSECKTDLCGLKSCPGQICVPTTGECRDDPCRTVTCPNACYACRMNQDGVASCAADPRCVPLVTKVKTQGGGVSCAVAGPKPASAAAPLLLLALAGAALRRRRTTMRLEIARGRRGR